MEFFVNTEDLKGWVKSKPLNKEGKINNSGKY